LVSGYKTSSDIKDMDLTVIHTFISSSYWAKNVPLKTMEKAINNSLCFGVFTDSGHQIVVIGFYVITWQTSVSIKIVCLFVLSFTVTSLLCIFIIKPFNLFRFLFGLKLNKTASSVAASNH
jgi:hypothetical protein